MAEELAEVLSHEDLARDDFISQREMEVLFDLRARLKRDAKMEEALTSHLMSKQQGGATHEPGSCNVHIKITQRKTVAWKEICVEHIGAERCEAIQKDTPATPCKPSLKVVKDGIEV